MRIALAAVIVGGCQLFVSSDVVQCANDGDCDGKGGDFAGTVCVDSLCVPHGDRCIGHVADVVEDRTKPLHARVRIADVGGNPMKGVEVLVCAALDENCDSAIGAPVLTDAAGYAYMTIWKNFQGSIQVKRPPTTADYFKLKLQFFGAYDTDDPPNRDIPIAQSARLLTKTLFALQLGNNAKLDPNAGHIIASTYDCDLKPRGGIQVAITTQAPGTPLLFYFTEAGLLSPDTTETPANGGIFGVINVPEGAAELTGTIAASGKRYGRVQVHVNKETISSFAIVPSPNP